MRAIGLFRPFRWGVLLLLATHTFVFVIAPISALTSRSSNGGSVDGTSSSRPNPKNGSGRSSSPRYSNTVPTSTSPSSSPPPTTTSSTASASSTTSTGTRVAKAVTPSTTSKTSTKPAFLSYQFAPNGVCIRPRYFVEEVIDTDQDQNSDNNGNESEKPVDRTMPSTATTSGKQLQQDAGRRRVFTMKNVPGEGDCMFLAVALATLTSMGLGGNDALLRAISRETRHVVASVLESGLRIESPASVQAQTHHGSNHKNDSNNNSNNNNNINSNGNSNGLNLVIEGTRYVTTQSLLLSAAKGEGLTPQQYIQQLRKEGTDGGLYGGGPELAVLANVLRRPISIYELDPNDNSVRTTASTEDMDVADGENLLAQEEDEQEDIYQRIICKGTFGEGTFHDPLDAVPDSAVLALAARDTTTTNIEDDASSSPSSSSLSSFRGAYSWHLHILVVDVDPSKNEKHACVLLPQ